MTLILTMIFYFFCPGSDQSHIRPFKSKRGTSHNLHDVILQLYIHNEHNLGKQSALEPIQRTQRGHSVIVCIKQALRKNTAGIVVLIMLKTLNKRAWNTEKCLLSI